MKSYKGLAIRYIKSQKKRTLLTIMGVVLSIALITAIGTMLKSLEYSAIKDTIKDKGNYHTVFRNIAYDEIPMIKAYMKVDKAGYEIDAGVANLFKDSYIVLKGYDDNLIEIMNIKPISGRMPKSDDEIALEKWEVEEMNPRPKIGDIITFDIKNVIEKDVYRAKFGKYKGTAIGESILDYTKGTYNKNFKLVGIVDNFEASRMTSIGSGIITTSSAKKMIKDNNQKYDLFVRIKKGLPIQESIKDISKIFNINSKDIVDNRMLLVLLGESKVDNDNNTTFGIIGFLVVLIVAATGAVIYNAFHMSVIERIRQFGVLRSIGATPSQIMKIVLREACVIAAISLPLGLICGILADKIVIEILNLNKFSILNGVDVIISPMVIAISAVVGVVAVFISALSPAIMAGRVSPIQAIMNISKEKLSKKKKRSITIKAIGLETQIAYRNLKRNKKRFLVTVFSMSIGIVIFIVFNTFCNYTFEGFYGKADSSSDYVVYSNPKDSDNGIGYSKKDYEDLKKIKEIKNISVMAGENCGVSFETNKLTKEYKDIIKKNYNFEFENLSNSEIFKPLEKSVLWGYEENEFKDLKKYLIKGNLDINKVNKENGVFIMKTVVVNDKSSGRQSVECANLKVGDYIYIDSKGEFSKESPNLSNVKKCKIEGIIERGPFMSSIPPKVVGVATSHEVYTRITGSKVYAAFAIQINENADKKVLKEELSKLSHKVRGGTLLDITEMSKRQENSRTTMKVMLYGFVAVISLIGMMNIINTISTNLILRTREFGTLRAVGMTMEQMKKMITIEGILYGVIGSLWGVVIGTGLAYCLFKCMVSLKPMLWNWPVQAIAISTIATILISVLATILPLKKVSNMNVIESIGVEE